MQTKVMGKIRGQYKMAKLGILFVFEGEMIFQRYAKMLFKYNNVHRIHYEDI